MKSIYIEWAKLQTGARFNLASSGVENYPIKELPFTLEDLDLNGPSLYGFEPLQRALAAKFDVDPECIVAAAGASMANHLAMAALIERGDEVLIEKPAYEPLLSVANYLDAVVKRFERPFENGFQIDLRSLERAVTKRTRLIVLTNLHNPSGALTDESALFRISEIARENDARVLVDEVYLEAMFERAPRSAFRFGEHFITTGSLTKAYGLSGLRCGWIIAEPALAEKIWRLNDLFGVVPAHPAERLSVIALANIDSIIDRSKALLDANRLVLNGFLDSREEIEAVKPDFGTVCFPRLIKGDAEKLFELLREKYDTIVVPGKFFEMPDHFRIGIGCSAEMLSGGLERLGAALDELNAVK